MRYIEVIIKIFDYLHIKTIYVNFMLLPFKDALKLPIVVSRKTKIKSLDGKVLIVTKVRTAMIKIGFGDVGIFDYRYERTILEVNGQIIFKGTAVIGKGSRICIGEEGVLELGNNFLIAARTTIICFKNIRIGADCVFSWENIIMDTDFHQIHSSGIEMNVPEPILIGNHVWIGMRCTILKGSKISEGCVIAAHTLISTDLKAKQAIYGGSPTKIIKQNITWN